MNSTWLTWPRPPLAATPREPVIAKAAAQRISFSGPQARALWQPRLERLGEVAIAIELEMVRRKHIPATVLWTGYDGIEALTERARRSALRPSRSRRRSVMPPTGRRKHRSTNRSGCSIMRS